MTLSSNLKLHFISLNNQRLFLINKIIILLTLTPKILFTLLIRHIRYKVYFRYFKTILKILIFSKKRKISIFTVIEIINIHI